jgi:hypothetical protein
MKEFELCNGAIIKVIPENEDEALNVSLTDLYEFELYGSTTLKEVFETLDQYPEEYESINIEKIFDEIDYDYDYETFINENLGTKHRWFLQVFLERLNQELLSNYTDNIISGEEYFYGEIMFNGEDSEEQVEKIIKLQNNLIDSENLLENVLNNWKSNEDIFYILKFSSNYDD